MSTDHPRIDALRERLLAGELGEARAALSMGSPGDLVAKARQLLVESRSARERFDALLRETDGADRATRAAAVDRYLRETSADRRTIERDVRAFGAGGDGTLDFAALGERLARSVDRLECRAEAHLAVARAASGALDPVLVAPLLAIAGTPGRWSRRTEALAWFRRLRPGALSLEATKPPRAALVALASPDEHRWVQPAALAALSAVDGPAAHAFARERFGYDRGGDDFIVRACIVALVGRARRMRWMDLLPLAHSDRSELVRMTAVRVEHDPAVLERIARVDESHRVRASAAIRLVHLRAGVAGAALCGALATDAHPFVVQTAAEELLRIARRRPERLPEEGIRALALAATRPDLLASVRAACSEALLELRVRSSTARSALEELAATVRTVPVGGSKRVENARWQQLEPDELSRALAVVARDDFGVGVDQSGRAAVLYRGERRSLSAWRCWHELGHPRASKRQAGSHATVRKLRGALRAPPALLAEATATQVPGERLVTGEAGGWGRDVPRVEDLLDTGVLRPRRIRIAGAVGVSTITAAPTFLQRLRGACVLTFRYARFAALRQRALSAGDSIGRGAYVRDVLRETGISIETVPHSIAPALAPAGLLAGSELGAVDLPTLHGAWENLAAWPLQGGAIGLSQLAGYGIALLGALVARQVVARHRVEANRSAIPLVIGGWGTRGKSGTERLKAALFQGLGYECLVKTTGCEAMFIHAIPGVRAHEVFVYRPYDKATVWEQEAVLSLAARLGVRAFFWECMALQPDLVNLLQSQWMHDDVATITNAFPDHEDVQGPSGRDVAETIAEFVPHQSLLLTTEVEMLPVLTETAAARGTRTVAVPQRETELVAPELLGRFSHSEHPANVALVAALARELGVAPLVAIVEMADNVVADLGALKTYPSIQWRGRTLSFTNGMGANDRNGTLQNWSRAGFRDHDPQANPSTWLVTVVNNRADRPARTEVFANILVEDLAAHRHVLIGTNLGGLLRSIRTALERHLGEIDPTRDLPEDRAEALRLCRSRVVRAFSRIMVRAKTPADIAREATVLGLAVPSELELERLITPGVAESYEAARLSVATGLGSSKAEEGRSHVIAMLAAQRLVRSVDAALAAHLHTRPAEAARSFAAAYRSLFLDTLLVLDEPRMPGDAIIDAIAAAMPPRAEARIMGIQNIKGTGLDFVYRWVSIERVIGAVLRLESASADERERAMSDLLLHDDYGIIDATLAKEAVERARALRRVPDSSCDALLDRLARVIAESGERVSEERGGAVGERLRKFGRDVLEVASSVRRRGEARRVMEAVIDGHISTGAAAARMRRIVREGKLD